MGQHGCSQKTKNYQKFQFLMVFGISLRFPSGWGDLDWEVVWGEKGEDNGGDVVAAVVHALAEEPHDLLEG